MQNIQSQGLKIPVKSFPGLFNLQSSYFFTAQSSIFTIQIDLIVMRLPSLSEYLKKKFTLLFFAVVLDGHYSQAINVNSRSIAVGGYYLFEPILSHVQPFQRNSHSLSWC